jgi:hypothetical protein
MEAASARMAARDRYGAFGEAPTSPLQRFICMHTAIGLWAIRANTRCNSAGLRPAELRAKPRAEPRDYRLD